MDRDFDGQDKVLVFRLNMSKARNNDVFWMGLSLFKATECERNSSNLQYQNSAKMLEILIQK